MHQPNVVRARKKWESDQPISNDISTPAAPAPAPDVERTVIAETRHIDIPDVRHVDMATGEIIDQLVISSWLVGCGRDPLRG